MLNIFKGWKTVTFNVLSSLVPLMELTELKSIVPVEYIHYYVLVIALINMLLRFVTSTAVGKK